MLTLECMFISSALPFLDASSGKLAIWRYLPETIPGDYYKLEQEIGLVADAPDNNSVLVCCQALASLAVPPSTGPELWILTVAKGEEIVET